MLVKIHGVHIIKVPNKHWYITCNYTFTDKNFISVKFLKKEAKQFISVPTTLDLIVVLKLTIK
jgi:hypothetical protein